MELEWNAVDLKQLLLDAKLWYRFCQDECRRSKRDQFVSELEFISQVQGWLNKQNIPLPTRPWKRSYSLLCVNDSSTTRTGRSRVEPLTIVSRPQAPHISLLCRDSISCVHVLDIDTEKRRLTSTDKQSTETRGEKRGGARLYRDVYRSTFLPCDLAWSSTFPSSAPLPSLKMLTAACFVEELQGYLVLTHEARFPIYCASIHEADFFVSDIKGMLDWKDDETIVSLCYAGPRPLPGTDTLVPTIYVLTRAPAPGFVAGQFWNQLYLLHLLKHQNLKDQKKQEEQEYAMVAQVQQITINKSYARITAMTYVAAKACLHLTDTDHHCIWRYHEKSASWTQVGGGKKWAPGFVDGSMKHAKFRKPQFITHNPQGYAFVVDADNKAIRVIHNNCSSVCTVQHPMSRTPFTLTPAPVAVSVSPSHNNVLHILSRDNNFHVVEWWHQSAELWVVLQRLLQFDDKVMLTITSYIYQQDEMNFCRSQVINTQDPDLPLSSSTRELIWSWFEFHTAADKFHVQHIQNREHLSSIMAKATGEERVKLDVTRLALLKLYGES